MTTTFYNLKTILFALALAAACPAASASITHVPLYTFHGDSAGDQFGVSVSGAGDVNGDGLADFIVGARDGGANGGGYARVFVSQIIPGPATGVVPEAASLVVWTLLGGLGVGYRWRRPRRT